MILASLTYVQAEFDQPVDWIRFIRFYLGVLEQLGREHEVHCFEQINYSGELSERGIRYHFHASAGKINRFPFRLHKAVREVKPDVVFVRGLHFPLQVILLRKALGKKATIIAQHHADKPPGGFKKILQQLADRSIDHYFFTDTAMQQEWLKRGLIKNDKKIKQVGMISSFFQPLSKEGARAQTGVSGSSVFLWVGNLDDNKDPLTVIKGFQSVARQHPGARLYMIFRGEELLKEVKKMIEQETDLVDRVILVGRIDHQQLENWYNSADFFISGSHSESYGASLSEAMSCGCIPVVTDIPSFRMMTHNGEYGFLFKAGDSFELSKVLSGALQADKEKEHSKVRAWFEQELSFKAIAKKINTIIYPK